MFNKLINNKNVLTIILTTIIFIVVFSFNNIFFFINKVIQNEYYNFRNAIIGGVANKNIVIVEIDEKTLESIGRHPFDRTVYANVIEKLTEKQAAIIAFDILFLDKTDSKSDKILSNSITSSGNVIFPVAHLPGNEIKKPLPIFLDKLKATGYLTPLVNKYNKVVYSIVPEQKFGEDNLLYFGVSILRKYYANYYNKDYSEYGFQNNFYNLTDRINIPLSHEKSREILINYIDSSKFNTISFVSLYDDESFKLYHDEFFKDKIIIIGTAAKGIKDIFYTPNGKEYGLYIHANFINTVLNKTFLIYFNKNLEILLVLLLILVSVYFNLSKSGYILFLSNFVISFLFLLVFPLLTIVYTSLILNFPTQLILGLILSLTFSNIVKYIIENIQKQKLNKALSEYVSKDIAEEVVFGLGKIKLDGEKKKITMFFSDIEGFTTISEKFSPEKLVKFLREYLKEMSYIIINEKGFINKYEGDSIIAFWGVFSEKSLPEDSHNACLSALIQLNKLRNLNEKWELDGMPKLNIRIGIHSGTAIIGNIGAEGKKIDFTALGDNVNIASRLEGVNKYYGTNICVSEVVYFEQKKFFEFRYLDKIKVKGKDKPIKIYELIGLLGDSSYSKKTELKLFGDAINLYLNKDFEKALIIFEKLKSFGDKPSLEYIKRCKKYIKNGVPQDWDGTWTMNSK
ncbi:hypothetical protein CSB08_00955 [Candidatus Gracilibacteria bacterium]|nr:MAG: hypothetical protein CSB08_00955 [Candidatus Gracilibacteria bacterium]